MTTVYDGKTLTTSLLKGFFVLIILAQINPLKADQIPREKEPPSKPISSADVIIEDQEILADCAEGKICVEGMLYNRGRKTAYGVQLRIDMGGSGKYIRPRTFITTSVEEPTMEPGQRQQFSLMINRHHSYRKKGEDKIIEVGRYNFQIVPLWKNAAPTPKKRKKKSQVHP